MHSTSRCRSCCSPSLPQIVCNLDWARRKLQIFADAAKRAIRQRTSRLDIKEMLNTSACSTLWMQLELPAELVHSEARQPVTSEYRCSHEAVGRCCL